MTAEQLEKYERLLDAVAQAEREFLAYKQELAAVCDHPELYVHEYTWEHDNGYGRQSVITGKRCTLCGATKAWGVNYPWHRN